MELSFRTVTGKIFKINIRPDQTLADAKVILQKQEGFETENCQFIYSASILSDSKAVGDLKIIPQTFIVIHCPTRPRPKPVSQKIEAKPVQAPSPQPFQQKPESPRQPPRVQSGPASSDPPNFQDMVSSLTEMGFSQEMCERALRASRYNPEAAVNLLISGEVEAAPPQNSPPPREPAVPDTPPRRSGKYGELQQTFDELTEDEKAAVERLEQLGLDSATVLQVYICCEKNESTATNCINTMMS